MSTEEMIRERLTRFVPDTVEVFDDSLEHAGHEGAKEGGGHFRLVIVSREFAGKSAVARHRLVYDALSDLMAKRIHALAIRAYAPEEMGTSAKG